MNSDRLTRPSVDVPVGAFETRTVGVAGADVCWYRFGTVSSTMDAARALADEGAAPWTLVSATTQTSGRGTKGRAWFSPPDRGLWVSAILPLPERLDLAADVALIAADALAGTLESRCGINAVIKHPNDLLVDGRKIAGIMVESVTLGGEPRCLVMGMGLNLTGTREDFDGAGLGGATSICLAGGGVPGTAELLGAFLERFIPAYDTVARTGR